MSETKYPAGQRPRARAAGIPTGRDTLILCRINSKTAYLRSATFVGEIAVSLDQFDVDIIRHADGTPVLETEQWPPLTPYDTGARLEPAVWVTPDRRRPEEYDPDRYGRVDFNNDENATDVTVWVERGESGGTIINIDGHSEIERIVVNAMDNVGPVPVDDGEVSQAGTLTAERLVELLREHGDGGDWIDTDRGLDYVTIDGSFNLAAIVAAAGGTGEASQPGTDVEFQGVTPRGFGYSEWQQSGDAIVLEVQESSIATRRMLWIGSHGGRAHLTEEQVREVRDLLTHWLDKEA